MIIPYEQIEMLFKQHITDEYMLLFAYINLYHAFYRGKNEDSI